MNKKKLTDDEKQEIAFYLVRCVMRNDYREFICAHFNIPWSMIEKEAARAQSEYEWKRKRKQKSDDLIREIMGHEFAEWVAEAIIPIEGFDYRGRDEDDELDKGRILD